MSLFGAACHIQVMNSLRIVYRNPVIETLLMGAVIIQIISGLKLWKRKKNQALSFFGKLQLSTGLYLAFFLIIHVSAVFIGRLVLHLDTNYYFGVAGLVTFPLNLFFIPYYSLAIFSFFGHLASIHYAKMTKPVFSMQPAAQSWVIFIFGCCFTLLLLFGLSNQFKGIEIPEAYNVLRGK